MSASGEPDFGPVIVGPLVDWRKANSDAQVANVKGRMDLTDADFECFVGIKALDMSTCNQSTITDAAFVHLTGIHTLKMMECISITGAGFVHLTGTGHTRVYWNTGFTYLALLQSIGTQVSSSSATSNQALRCRLLFSAVPHLQFTFFPLGQLLSGTPPLQSLVGSSLNDQ